MADGNTVKSKFMHLADAANKTNSKNGLSKNSGDETPNLDDLIQVNQLQGLETKQRKSENMSMPAKGKKTRNFSQQTQEPNHIKKFTHSAIQSQQQPDSLFSKFSS